MTNCSGEDDDEPLDSGVPENPLCDLLWEVLPSLPVDVNYLLYMENPRD